jgi:hypothetical protein
MFVYQNKSRDICVTFKSRMPVSNPEYVITIDHKNGTIKVNGEEMVPASSVEDATTETEQVNEEPVAQEESIEPVEVDETETPEEDEIEE